MAGINKFIGIGNLGKDPEIKTFDSGNKLASFSVATSREWKDKESGEKKSETEWINCVVWGKLADVVEQYVKKGNKIYIEGRLKTRSWEKDGSTFYRTEIMVSNLVMLGSKSSDGSSNGPQEAPIKEDDLPF